MIVTVEGIDELNHTDMCQSFADALIGSVRYCNTTTEGFTVLHTKIGVTDLSEAKAAVESHDFISSLTLPSGITITSVSVHGCKAR